MHGALILLSVIIELKSSPWLWIVASDVSKPQQLLHFHPQNISLFIQLIASGQILRGSTLDLNPNFKASSRYSISYLAAKAATGGYWCSKKGAAQPAYWWIYFEQEQVEIVEIRFHEVYAGATFEFFASNAKECSNTYTGRKLINGTRDEINGKIFVNGKRYHCYGLKITNLPTTTKWGKIATLQNFEFFVHCEYQVLSS